MKLRHRLKRWLGIVSPSGAYPLPPRRAMSEQGRNRWYPELPQRDPDASGHRPGNSWASDVAAGPLTRFGTNGREHVCAPLCEPSNPSYRPCFDRTPYVSQKDREAGC